MTSRMCPIFMLSCLILSSTLTHVNVSKMKGDSPDPKDSNETYVAELHPVNPNFRYANFFQKHRKRYYKHFEGTELALRKKGRPKGSKAVRNVSSSATFDEALSSITEGGRKKRSYPDPSAIPPKRSSGRPRTSSLNMAFPTLAPDESNPNDTKRASSRRSRALTLNFAGTELALRKGGRPRRFKNIDSDSQSLNTSENSHRVNEGDNVQEHKYESEGTSRRQCSSISNIMSPSAMPTERPNNERKSQISKTVTREFKNRQSDRYSHHNIASTSSRTASSSNVATSSSSSYSYEDAAIFNNWDFDWDAYYNDKRDPSD